MVVEYKLPNGQVLTFETQVHLDRWLYANQYGNDAAMQKYGHLSGDKDPWGNPYVAPAAPAPVPPPVVAPVTTSKVIEDIVTGNLAYGGVSLIGSDETSKASYAVLASESGLTSYELRKFQTVSAGIIPAGTLGITTKQEFYAPSPAIPPDYPTIYQVHSYQDSITGEVINYTPALRTQVTQKAQVTQTGKDIISLLMLLLAH